MEKHQQPTCLAAPVSRQTFPHTLQSLHYQLNVTDRLVPDEVIPQIYQSNLNGLIPGGGVCLRVGRRSCLVHANFYGTGTSLDI